MSHTQTTRPQSATEILRTASETLGERGKQYDPAGKQERSMTAIVAAFNAIYPRNLLTVHMGWQFMSLVKMVRGATKPHADSALDQVAYAALAAECVAGQLHQPAPTDAQAMAEALSKHKEPRLTPYQKEHTAVIDSKMRELLKHNRNLEVQLDTLRASFEVEKLRERELLDIETINDLRAELAGSTRAMQRAQDEVQSLLAERRHLHARNKELEEKVQSLNNEVEAKVRELMSNMRHEAPCAHNTDEPKAPRPEYVDPFDQYGDTQPLASKPRIVGGLDPARGGLAYPNGKPL